jgi:hypothetical protein
MKKMLLGLGLALGLGVAATAQAKCYHYENAPSDVYVCVGKGGSDSFADRNKGQEICSAKSGKKCGPVGSSSSSCHSNIDKCYDESGTAHRELSGY